MPVSLKVRNSGALKKQLSRLVSELGYEAPQALRYGTVELCRSLRARTRKAPALRRVSPLKDGGFAYTAYASGKPVRRVMSAKTKDSAKRSRAVLIRYSGLAKMAWGWAMQDLFGTAAADNGRFARPKSALETTKTPSMIRIQNRLNYAVEALKGGNASIAQASVAASNKIRKTIERRLAKNGAKK